MKILLLLGLLAATPVAAVLAQSAHKESAAPDQNKPLQVVEASCGQCQLGLPGKSCDLAIRLNGHAYFLDGSNIDSHGDAHAKDGFCQKIRRAEVQGELVDNRFMATYFRLLPEAAKTR